MNNDELAALILEWAKNNHQKGYDETIRVSGRERAYRLRLLRLIEIRCEREPGWRNTVPLRVLNETSIQVRVRHAPSGRTMTVGGVESPPGTNDLNFNDLTWLRAEDIVPVLDSIAIFDAERV